MVSEEVVSIVKELIPIPIFVISDQGQVNGFWLIKSKDIKSLFIVITGFGFDLSINKINKMPRINSIKVQ